MVIRNQLSTDDDVLASDEDFLEDDDELSLAPDHLARRWLAEDQAAGRAARLLTTREKIERWHEERRIALQDDPFLDIDRPNRRRRGRRTRNIH